MAGLRESLESAIAEQAAREAKLKATLTEWGDDEDAPAAVQTVTINTKDNMAHTQSVSVSEGTFNFIKDHPYTTKMDAVKALANMGFNPGSTTSLLSHMIRQRLISCDMEGKLTAIVGAYVPLRAAPKKDVPRHVVHKPYRPKLAPIVRVAETATGGIAALDTSAPVNVKSLLDSISVNEARAFYLELKNLFGGN
tara:strand:- start:3644 stop:4228 length:585 start_codon:yes stop_codon:yes gene_type:complete